MKKLFLVVACSIVSIYSHAQFSLNGQRYLSVGEMIDIQFRILDSESKDLLVERADTIIPTDSYNQKVEWDFKGNSVGYNLFNSCQINVCELSGDGLFPCTDFKMKCHVSDEERVLFFVEEIESYLKEKKGYKGDRVTTIKKSNHRKYGYTWKDGFAFLDLYTNDGFTFNLMFTLVYDMRNQNIK